MFLAAIANIRISLISLDACGNGSFVRTDPGGLRLGVVMADADAPGDGDGLAGEGWPRRTGKRRDGHCNPLQRLTRAPAASFP